MIIAENTRLYSLIDERLHSVAEKSTLHGLANFASANTSKWKQALWLTFFLLTTSLFASMTFQNIAEYFSWPVTSRIRFTNEKEIDFPGVAICNANPFVTEQAVQFLIQFTRNYTGNYTLGLKEMNKQLMDQHFRYTTANHVYFNYSVSAKKQLGLPLENFLIYCKYANEPCYNSTNWTWFFSWWNGNCFLFNSKSGLKVRTTNKNSALNVELFAGHEETTYQKASGFQIFIFNQTNYIGRDEYIPRTYIRTGVEVNVEIKRRFIHKLPEPYSECDLDLRTADINSVDSELYRETFRTNASYEQIFCLHRAYRRTVFEQCKCVVELSDVKGSEAKICSTKEEQACRIYIDNVLYQLKRFDGKFNDLCPLECNVNDFQLVLSSMAFPSYHYGNYLLKTSANFKASTNRTYDLHAVRKSVAKINFHFTKIGHETMDEKKTMTVVNLFANTGAMLSVFLGMSLLTLVEGLQLLVEICALFVSHLIVFKL